MTNALHTTTPPPAYTEPVLFSLLHHSNTTPSPLPANPLAHGSTARVEPDDNRDGYICSDDDQSRERIRLVGLAASALTNSIYRDRSTRMFDCGQSRLKAGRRMRFLCGSQGCPFCYGNRLGRIRTPLANRVESLRLNTACHILYVTVSLPPVEDAQLGEAFDTLTKGFHGLCRKKPFADALGTVFAKEFTVSGSEELHPHAHAVLLFSSREQADFARFCLPSYFAMAAQFDSMPYFYWEPIVAADSAGLRNVSEYAAKLPAVEEFQQLLDYDPTRYVTVYSAINGPRPGGTRKRLINMTGVFKAGNKVTAKHLMAMGSLSKKTN